MRDTLQAQKICFENATFEMIASNVRRKLSCGPDRIQHSLITHRWLLWPNKASNQLQNTEKAAAEVEREYREELSAIREALLEIGPNDHHALMENPNANGNGNRYDSADVADQRFFQILEAMSVWDYIGNPVRQKGELIFHIGRPRVVEDRPTIQAMPLRTYIEEVRSQTAEYYRQNMYLRRQRLLMGVCAFAVVGIALFV